MSEQNFQQLPDIEELTRQRKPEEFSWRDYADLDFDAMILIGQARSVACALIAEEGESTVPTEHRNNCLSLICSLLDQSNDKVEKLGELSSLLERKKSENGTTAAN